MQAFPCIVYSSKKIRTSNLFWNLAIEKDEIEKEDVWVYVNTTAVALHHVWLRTVLLRSGCEIAAHLYGIVRIIKHGWVKFLSQKLFFNQISLAQDPLGALELPKRSLSLHIC